MIRVVRNRSALGLALASLASPVIAGGMGPAVTAPEVSAEPSGVQFRGAVTLGYSHSSIGDLPFDVDFGGMSLDIETDIIFTRQFGVGLDFGFASRSLDIEGVTGDIDVDLTSLAVEPAYVFASGGYVGAYYRTNDLDVGVAPLPASFGVDTESMGLFAGYRSGQLRAEGWFGVSDTDPSLPDDVDVTDYGIAGSYEIDTAFEAFGSIVRTDIDAAGTDLSLTAYSIGGDYDFGNGFAAYGSVGMLDIDLGPAGDFDATGMTLGGSYEFDANGTPLVLSAEYSYTGTDLDGLAPSDPHINQFAVGLTIPLGGSSEPLNSNTRTARGDYRSAISALAQSF